jgi:hypothetical protein
MAKEVRKGVISVSFNLRLTQDPQNNDDLFTLEATDKTGDTYATRAEPVSTRSAWVALLLRRIANANGQPGWKFDATFDTTTKTGVIDG